MRMKKDIDPGWKLRSTKQTIDIVEFGDDLRNGKKSPNVAI